MAINRNRRKVPNQIFNDGNVTFFKLENIAEKGDKPKYQGEKLVTMRFSERGLSFSRVYEARQAMEEASRVIRIQHRPEVEIEQIAEIEKKQYRVKVLQVNTLTTPRCFDITLEKLEEYYNVNGRKT